MEATPEELAGEGQEGRRDRRHRHLRLEARVLVRVDGDHADRGPAAAARRARPVRATTTRSNVRGKVTHGHLAENRNHGGRKWTLPDARDLRRRPRCRTADGHIKGFVYGQGDMVGRGSLAQPAGRRAGPGADLLQRGRPAPDRAHDHRVQGAVQQDDRHRLPAGRRGRAVRLGPARLRPGPDAAAQRDAARPPGHDAEGPERAAPTRTSAASTRSCAGRSGSSQRPAPAARGSPLASARRWVMMRPRRRGACWSALGWLDSRPCPAAPASARSIERARAG